MLDRDSKRIKNLDGMIKDISRKILKIAPEIGDKTTELIIKEIQKQQEGEGSGKK